jgi:hypothetical protein
MFEIDQQINEYRASLTAGFFTPKDVVPNSFLDNQLRALENPLNIIRDLISRGKPSVTTVAKLIEQEPAVIDVIRLILALPREMEFRDGRKFPDSSNSSFQDKVELATLINDIGFWDLISRTPGNIETLLAIALIHRGRTGRQLQAIRNIEKEIEELIVETISVVNTQPEINLTIVDPKNARFTFRTRRTLDYIIYSSDVPVAAIDVLLLSNPGGSQLFDVRKNYPNLQEELNAIPMKLILIADGQGMIHIPNDALEEMFTSVYSVMSINQAKMGMLANALIEAATGKQTKIEPVDRIIESILLEGSDVGVEQIPQGGIDPRLALAQYVTAHPDLDLKLTTEGKSLKWNKANLIRQGNKLKEKYQSRRAIELFVKLLKVEASPITTHDNGHSTILDLEASSILPAKALTVAFVGEPNDEIYRDLARESLRTVPNAKMMFLLVPNKTEIQSLPDKNLQSTIPANVILVDINDLIHMAQNNKDSYDSLVAIILEQSDLTKISPFVINSATPKRMYYGRDQEEATLLSTLATNSIALLGSRKIGKTSLLMNAKEGLERAGFATYFLDCQTVNNWTAFGEMARRFWNIDDLPSTFEPRHLFEMVRKIKAETNKDLVILLDEIDQLLHWDTTHAKEQVSEAFFKACRTISQGRDAQFVFSGERTISEKLWDPHSPHWNFCKPLQLRQLTKSATQDLIMQPLQSLQINIEKPKEFSEKVWTLTSGHPQLVQLLGDKLVNTLNQRAATDRTITSAVDLDQISETPDFQEQYLATYWGQATDLEKLISLLIVMGINQPARLLEEFRSNKVYIDEGQIISALQILELYGIIDAEGNKYKLRAAWFSSALDGYGDINATIERHWRRIK